MKDRYWQRTFFPADGFSETVLELRRSAEPGHDNVYWLVWRDLDSGRELNSAELTKIGTRGMAEEIYCLSRALDEERVKITRLEGALDEALAANDSLRERIEHLEAQVKAYDKLLQVLDESRELWMIRAGGASCPCAEDNPCCEPGVFK
jgi:hypothetical protein